MQELGFILPFCIIAFANGAIYPIVSHKALSVFKQQTAFAAGFQNFISLFTCFAFSALVTQIINYSAVYSVLIVMTLVCILLYFFNKLLINIDKNVIKKMLNYKDASCFFIITIII